MTTELLDATDPATAEAAIARAAELLTAGAVVAIPTETVYGLAADARHPGAVAAIFAAKGRPSHNPLIVHVADADEARRWAAEWPAAAEALAARFWPGPLTMVLPLRGGLAHAVTAGGATVGLRAPAHPVARRLLQVAAMPLAAPSANPSNRLSPTTAAMVMAGLGGRIPAVLDGGPCDVGLESTVLSLAGPEPRILRPGMISAAMLAEALGRPVASGPAPAAGGAPLPSPGMLPRHYSPALPLVLEDTPHPAPGVAVIRLGVEIPAEAAGFARALYAALRAAETSGADRIILQRPPAGPEWDAIHDRLRRATHP